MPFDLPTYEGKLYVAEDRWRSQLAQDPEVHATVDFETRSECDLKKHGSWIYSKHPSTEALCLAYKLPGWDEPALWHRAHPQHLIAESDPPLELFAFIKAGGLVEAHNSFFERCVWRHVMVPQHGWPEVPGASWRCSAARASAASLPRDLDGAVRALGLHTLKDKAGHSLMLRMSKPRKLRKAERAELAERGDDPAAVTVYHEEEEDLYRLWEYCRQDVRAEEALSHAVPELSLEELEVWKMDQEINERGALFDLDLARCALDMAARWRDRLNSELEQMTGISSATKRQKVRDWLLEHEELDLPDTAADTLEWYLEGGELSGRARRVCEIVMDVNRTSTRKYQAMLDRADEDGRVRDLLMYHGAGTGRWSGKGVQIHNFPARDLIVKDFDDAAECIRSGNVDWCVAMYGDVMKLLSHSLRGAIIAPEGRDLSVADYSAIEARCVLWLAEATEALKVFHTGGDIYCDMATGIYGFPVLKSVAKDWRHPEYKLHSGCRQFGKQAILGLGFGMGFVTFLLTCRKYGIHFSMADVIHIMGEDRASRYISWVQGYLAMDPGADADPGKRRQARMAIRRLVDAREKPGEIVHELALMKYTVDVYRSRYTEVKALWGAQEAAAIAAVKGGVDGDPHVCGRVSWFMRGQFLHCKLPSGRLLSYCDPEVKMVRTSWGETRPGLRYMSVNGVTRKWERTATYGGKLVENMTQAVARDIMAVAMLAAHRGGTYDTIMSVHDELVCEVDENKGSLPDFERLMSSMPAWAEGCPIEAEAARFKRYRK